jgi:hypothetical protein
MKKFSLLIVLFLGFNAQDLLAQAMITNRTNYNLAITVGNQSFILSPGGVSKTRLFPKNGDVQFELSWEEGRKSKSIKVSEEVENGSFTINENHLRKIESPKREREEVVLQPSNSQIGFSTKLAITNQSSHTILIIDGKLNGLALKPGQSSDSINFNLGLVDFSLLVDLDKDTISSGRNFAQKVVVGIIAKDQKSFLITDHNLFVTVLGGVTQFIFENKTSKDLVGSGGTASGKVIKAHKALRDEVSANEGFVATTWHYFDDRGIKKQTMVEFIVVDDKGRAVFYIHESDLKKIYGTR